MRKIIILIEEEITETTLITKNVMIERNPTDLTKETYAGSGKLETAFQEKYEPREVSETKSRKNTLLKQELEDDSFPLADVIKAINSL